jgi:hypothetical protein
MAKIKIYVNWYEYSGDTNILMNALENLTTNYIEGRTRFVASEVNVAGATLMSLCKMGLIKVVGTRETWVKINEDTMKRRDVNVYEFKMLPSQFIAEVRHCILRGIETEMLCISSRIQALNEEYEELSRMRAKYMGF